VACLTLMRGGGSCDTAKSQGCNGGWTDGALSWIVKNKGQASVQDYPYQGEPPNALDSTASKHSSPWRLFSSLRKPLMSRGLLLTLVMVSLAATDGSCQQAKAAGGISSNAAGPTCDEDKLAQVPPGAPSAGSPFSSLPSSAHLDQARVSPAPFTGGSPDRLFGVVALAAGP
jgi:hypothetical protein